MTCRFISLSTPTIEAVGAPCPGPFHCSHIVDYIYYFCLLHDPDVGLSILVCDVEHTSFHFGLCGRMLILLVFGECPVQYCCLEI